MALGNTGIADFGRKARRLQALLRTTIREKSARALYNPNSVADGHENGVDGTAQIDQRSAQKLVKLVLVQSHDLLLQVHRSHTRTYRAF
jgi:hypothetical protein